MDIAQVYATAAGGIFLVFIIVNFVSYISRFVEHISFWMLKYLIYLYLINRHRFIDLWSCFDVLVQFIYIIVNIFCLSFQVSTILKAGLRAGIFFLINIILCLLVLILAFLQIYSMFRWGHIGEFIVRRV
jgi:hypothetical protein